MFSNDGSGSTDLLRNDPRTGCRPLRGKDIERRIPLLTGSLIVTTPGPSYASVIQLKLKNIYRFRVEAKLIESKTVLSEGVYERTVGKTAFVYVPDL